MKALLLNQYVGKDIQLKFKGDIAQAPIGPARLERVDVVDGHVVSEAFKLLVPAAHIDPVTKQPKQQFIMPMIFDAEDVLWISPGPLNMEGEQAIVTPGNGNRSPSGLVLPR